MAMEITRKNSAPEVTFCNETSLIQHETIQPQLCLGPESSLDVEEIKKKLMDYNRDLKRQDRTNQDMLYQCKQNKNMIHPYMTSDSLCTRSQIQLIILSVSNHSEERLKLEKLIPHITPELLTYLYSFFVIDAGPYLRLIFHHELAKKIDQPAREHFIDSADTLHYISHYHLKPYFDLYWNDSNPEVSFDLIHKVWKYHPWIDLTLRLLCCERLLKNKHYDILNRVIQNNEEYFLIVQKNFGPDQRYLDFDLMKEYRIYLTVLLILLCNNVTSRQKANITTVLMLIEHISELLNYHSANFHVRKGCEYFILLTIRLQQTKLIPSLIKVLLNRPKLHLISQMIILLCNESLLKVDCHKKSMNFIKDNSHYILNVPFILEERECHARHTQCKLLLTLMHAYMGCDDLTNTNHVLNRLLKFRHSLVSTTGHFCACFIGKQDCNPNGPCLIQDKQNKKRFDLFLLLETLNMITDLETEVIKKQLKPVSFLKHMIYAVEENIVCRDFLIEKFIYFIEQISIQNVTGLYDIIKSLCDLEMQTEIQDMFIQGLTYYIHVKCNKQNSIYLSLLLDINMTCYKGEFLRKLSINMGQLLLLNVDTGNDVEKIIYRCFCKVRHENKEIDIEKYQIHFSFISTMDAEGEMLKILDMRSFLLMLILLMISSGSQHKSAKLKKYLSLKYAYEDAILYLLWCSGDVEINPGPTRSKLKRKADSEKKRKWILEMCMITLKLLKNIALDYKPNGIWKEKPDSWQELNADKPFYNPRKRPNKQLNDKTDEELLRCLLNCCNWKNLTLPSNFQREITAWKSDKQILLELCVTRWEIEDMRTAKDLLFTYKENPDLKQNLKDYNVDLSFNPNSTQEESPKGYSDVVRDLATTFCRISNSLPILVKKDGMWKTPPHDWNTNDLYYDPYNTAKRHEQDQDQTLVDDLLFYCEKKFIPIPSELQLVVKAWKLGNRHDISKHYTIWSSIAIIQRSIKYLELQGLLEKPDVQQSLKQIGVSLHCEKDQKNLNNVSTVTTDNESKVSGLSMNSLSNNLRGTYSSSSLCSACSQHPYEAKALNNSHSTKSVIKCSKPDFQNHPSTSGCTFYSTLVPCTDSRGDLQYTDERLDIPDSYKSVSEISCQEPDFQPSTSSCTFDSKRAPCRENSVDLQPKDERDLSDSHKSLPEISCEEPDLQPSSSRCSTFTKRAEYLNVRENFPPTERLQKRSRPSSKERSDKRPRLHSGNESQASTSSTTRCTDDTTPSSHCDLENADQNVHSSEEDKDQGLSSNRIPVPDNIQDTDSSKDQLYGSEDKIPNHLHPYINGYLSCDTSNLEDNLIEDIDIEWWETL